MEYLRTTQMLDTDRIIFEGLGGQGVLSAGRFLAYASTKAGLHATFSPSYGAEVRGGMSHCDVVISKENIQGFIVETPTTMILLSEQSWEQWINSCPEDCTVMVNSSLAETKEYSGSNKIIRIPASRVADEIGFPQVANSVMLGAYIGLRKTVSIDFMIELLDEIMPKHQKKTIPYNAEALRLGYESMII